MDYSPYIIGKLQEDAEGIVFCEFHDDMAEFSPNNQQYQFFQIKKAEERDRLAELGLLPDNVTEERIVIEPACIGKNPDACRLF